MDVDFTFHLFVDSVIDPVQELFDPVISTQKEFTFHLSVDSVIDPVQEWFNPIISTQKQARRQAYTAYTL